MQKNATPASAYIRVLTAARQVYRSFPTEIEQGLTRALELAKDGKLEEFEEVSKALMASMRQMAEIMQRRIETGHREVMDTLVARRKFMEFTRQIAMMDGDEEKLRRIDQIDTVIDSFLVEGLLVDL